MSSATQHAQLTTKAVETTGDRPANVRSGEKWMRVISTARVADRDDEVIDTASLRIPLKPKGWKYARDLADTDTIDMGFFYDHQMAAEKQLGSVRSMFVNGDGELETVVAFTSLQRGQDAYTLAKEGHLGNSLSGTFSYRTASQDEAGVFYDMEMIELSLVFKGANQNARVLEVSKRFKGESMAEAKTLDQLEAEAADLQKQIDAAKAVQKDADVEPPVEVEPEAPAAEEPEKAEPTEAEPAPAEPAEVQPEAEEPAETPAEPVEVEEQPPQSKSIKQEQPTMKDVAVKQVKDAPEQPAVDAPAEKSMDKYELAAAQFSAWVNKDAKKLADLNQKALATYDVKSKATYMNTGVVADGGAIVPSNELLTDVFTTLSNYSTVSNDLRVVTLTEGNGLDVATLVTDVVVSEVSSEGGNKPVTKPTLGDGEISLREFAGIAIITKKLVRQAAINVYDLLRESFARAIANQRAVMALTDATSGIVNKSGVVEVETAAALPTWQEIRKMPYALPVAAVPGAKYYISRELLEELDTNTLDGENRDLDVVELSGDGLSGRFKNGFTFAVEEVLGKSGAPHAVFGNMGRYGILLRQGTVESETFDTGSVVDGSSVTHNLLQQNKLAHRVAFYENVGYPLPGAFAVTAEAEG